METLVQGIFASCNEVFNNPTLPQSAYERVTASFGTSCSFTPPTATSCACSSVAVTYPKASPPYVTSAPIACGNLDCQTYNPYVDSQTMTMCHVGTRCENCECSPSWNHGTANVVSGPLNTSQHIEEFYEALESITLPTWNLTLMEGHKCDSANAIVETHIASLGWTTAPCQSLPTPVIAVDLHIGDGLAANFHYDRHCQGPYDQFIQPFGDSCNFPSDGRRYFNSYEIVSM